MQLIVKEGCCFLGILGIWKKPMKSMILMTMVPQMQPITLTRRRRVYQLYLSGRKFQKANWLLNKQGT